MDSLLQRGKPMIICARHCEKPRDAPTSMQGSKRKDRTKLPRIRDDMLLIEKSRPKKLIGVMASPLEELLDVGGTCLPFVGR